MVEADIPENLQEKLNLLLARLENTKEKMEIETYFFIELTKQFALEWTQREVEAVINSLENEAFPVLPAVPNLSGNSENLENSENLVKINEKFNNEKLSRLKSGLKELPHQIPDIVETHLNNNYYWVHRSKPSHSGISRDYIEFRKDKMLKELTISIRFILGSSSEIIIGLSNEMSEEKGWVKEKGKRKYVCFLRFSDEMTASLNRYFDNLEELFALNHEINEEILKPDIKDKTDHC
jgi:hypothetical protein